MKHIIKVLNQPFLHHFLTHEWGGRVFHFLWNKAEESYVYEPKSESEAELIMNTPKQFCPWVFFQKFIIEPGEGASDDVKNQLELARAELLRCYNQLGGAPADLPTTLTPGCVSDSVHAKIAGLLSEIQGLRATEDTALAAIDEAEVLRKLIGTPPEGSHPDEAKPRGETWHHERRNWIAELDGIRGYVRELEAKLAAVPKASPPAKVSRPAKPVPQAEPSVTPTVEV